MILVRALPPGMGDGRNYGLHFELDGLRKDVAIRIEGLSRSLVSDLPDLSLDLLEIAALVYGCDAAVSRGGPVDAHLGQAWYRSYAIKRPVRCPDVWRREDIRASLEKLLTFISEDRFQFTFTKHAGTDSRQGFFEFSTNESWQADRVMMFSGGLDSFAGALEEVFERRQKVALVSHFSATKIAPRQRALKTALEEHCGPGSCKHFPVKVQLGKGANKETTYRTRSFLFAVLGMIVAQCFGLDRVSFFENGVVSLNLPPVANVVGTGAASDFRSGVR